MLAKVNPYSLGIFDSFEDFFSGLRGSYPGWREKDGKYILKVEVPGFTEEDIKIEIKEGCLTINGKCEEKDDDTFSSTKEVKHTSWVPPDVDLENVSAELKSGILAISVPKIEKKEIKGKEVPIKLLK